LLIIPAETTLNSSGSPVVIQPIAKAFFEASQSFKEDGNLESFFG